MFTSRPAPALAATILVAVLAACTPAASDGGEIVLSPDDRVAQVLAAREALAEPVPVVTAEAERLVAALEGLWLSPAAGDGRSDLIASMRTQPFEDAVAALDAVALDDAGQDAAAVRAAVDALTAASGALSDAVSTELDGLVALATHDEQLGALLEQWDAPGQYSGQIAAFEQLALDARALADEAEARTATPACTDAWSRRVVAADTVADRTDELLPLIRNRRGQEFDELRDSYRQDPFGLGALLVELDAEAAEACWAEGSAVPGLLNAVLEARDGIAAALDPDDL